MLNLIYISFVDNLIVNHCPRFCVNWKVLSWQWLRNGIQYLSGPPNLVCHVACVMCVCGVNIYETLCILLLRKAACNLRIFRPTFVPLACNTANVSVAQWIRLRNESDIPGSRLLSRSLNVINQWLSYRLGQTAWPTFYEGRYRYLRNASYNCVHTNNTCRDESIDAAVSRCT